MKFNQAYQGLLAAEAPIPVYPVVNWNYKNYKTTDEKDEESRFRFVRIALRTDPSDVDSQTYYDYFAVFEEGTPEE
eukprot:scaffold4786_cov71-Cylindrotheca_fusiformis.AAC.1